MKLLLILFSILMLNFTAIADNSTQNDFNYIKKYIESEKKAKEDKKDAARLAFKKAEMLAADGKIKEATLNFAIACSTDIEEGEYLKGYVQTILRFAEKLINKNKAQEAFQLISEIEYYIYANPQLIAPENADSAILLLNQIESALNNARFAINSEALIYDDEAINLLIENANDVLNVAYGKRLSELEQYSFRLDAIASRLVRLPENLQGEAVRAAIASLSKRYEELSTLIDAEKLFAKADELIAQVKLQSESVFVNSLLNELNSIIQRLITSNLYEVKSRAAKLNIEYERLTNELNSSASQKYFDKIKKKYDATVKRLIKNETNATKAIDILSRLNDEVILESSKIYDKNYLMQLKDLSYLINNEVDKWRLIQNNRYERWAVKTIDKFYSTYKGELGVLTSSYDSKNRIYLGLNDYICKIDVKYLSHSSFKIYTEVFDLFYKELDREQRLKISTDFLTCEKRSLSEF